MGLAGEERDAAAPPGLARRRARSPEIERAAVELAIDGALLCKHARAYPGVPAVERRLCSMPRAGERRRGCIPHNGG